MNLQTRVMLAVGLFVGIYLIGLGMGALLYVSGAIGTGPLHTECEGYRATIAEEQGIAEEDVEQEQIKALATECHEAEKAQISDEEAFRERFLFWSLWPAAVIALASLLWPWWADILRRQELAHPHTAVE